MSVNRGSVLRSFESGYMSIFIAVMSRCNHEQPSKRASGGEGRVMDTEHVILLVWLFAMALGVLGAAVGVGAFARWLVRVIADAWFGRQPGGRR